MTRRSSKRRSSRNPIKRMSPEVARPRGKSWHQAAFDHVFIAFQLVDQAGHYDNKSPFSAASKERLLDLLQAATDEIEADDKRRSTRNR